MPGKGEVLEIEDCEEQGEGSPGNERREKRAGVLYA